MSKISDKLNIISSAKNDIKTAIENKGVSVGDIGIQEYASKIDEMQVATPPAKGFIVNEFDADGYPTDISIVGMTSIPDYYFQSSFGSNLFKNIKSNSNLHLPNDLKSIGKSAFYQCSNLALTELPDSITKIDSKAFQYCGNLALTKLPDNLTTLNQYAFRGCSKITINEIPAGVDVLNSYVFYDCSGLRTITCLGPVRYVYQDFCISCKWVGKFILPNITSVPTLTGYPLFPNSYIESGTGYIYVPDALVDSFKTATNWSTYAAQIKGISELEG